MGKSKAKAKPKKTTIKAGGGLAARVAKSISGGLTGGSGKGSGKKRRSKSPSYWANKVLVEKLKRKYFKLKYGGLR